ncbi:MBL fold metallo-hydrolase [Zooshikella harenae]|uniref:MBL fold metallo-hydrolase n=1 Tax=Zooshikella harenae TaxID=2827238 RepID=A0ABS5Z6L8_9GAMM|nr:MBL fold metallo-hydrolase [Zooshikella harenae]MBU2709645.1 MBL fold metallo-hydrolase [Zooshikella harenae]
MDCVLPITPNLAVQPEVIPFYDQHTQTLSYIVRDPDSSACAIIDPVADFDYASGSLHFAQADQLIHYIEEHNLSLEWILETHIHADHLTSANYLQQHIGGKLAIANTVTDVQYTFAKFFNDIHSLPCDGSQFNTLFNDGDSFQIGQLTGHVLHTPGHTPACVSYVIGNATFVGDTLFMPDSGTARTDFPGGDAKTLYQSIQRIFSLPNNMRLFMCHDYCPDGRQLQFESSVKEEREKNIHINSQISEQDFITLRQQRDATLAMPQLIIPSLQVNIRAGKLPPPADNGAIYLKLPINGF